MKIKIKTNKEVNNGKMNNKAKTWLCKTKANNSIIELTELIKI